MTTQAEAQPKQGAGAFIFSIIIATTLGYIITKEVYIPTWIMAIGIAAGGIVLFLRGISHPEMVTYVLVAYLPFSSELAGDFGGLATAFNLTNILLIFVILVWMTGRYAVDEPIWIKNSINPPLILFLLIGFIAVLRGSYYGSGRLWIGVIQYKRWITPFILFFLILNTVKDKQTIKQIVNVIIFVTTLVGLMAIYDYIEIGNVSSLEKARVGGIVDQPNMLAAFFNYYMFLPLGFLLMNMRKFKYWLLLIPFLICFRGIMVTFSRGGYLAFALGMYAITFFRSKLYFAFLLFFTWLAALNPILLPAGIRYRMGQTLEQPVSYVETTSDIEGSLETSSRSRVEVWKGGLKMVADYPFFGVGYDLFQPMIKYYWSGERPIDAHNTYLIIAAEMGIPALIIFLWLIGLVFWNTYALYKSTHDPYSKALALGFLGGLFALLMNNMFGSRLDSQEVFSYFWILAAMIVRLRIIDERERRLGVPQNIPAGAAGAIQRPVLDRRYKLDGCWFDGAGPKS
ncbi:MAG: O-antigen ligase family protein [Candidatus Omnitrophica bacterium]|nr:O-antigen ligase family protein [Candidatus Omnitrophota bacterium]